EHFDEQAANRLALDLGVGHAFELRQEQILRLHMHQRYVVVLAVHGDDLLALALTHQAVVDEDAGEALADRFMDQDSCNRRIDAARKRADYAAVTDLLADRFDRLLAVGLHGPVASKSSNAVNEVRKELRSVRRMDHLRVELDSIEAALFVGD